MTAQVETVQRRNMSFRGGLLQSNIVNHLATSGTQNYSTGSLGFPARVSHRFSLTTPNLTGPKQRAVRFPKKGTEFYFPDPEGNAQQLLIERGMKQRVSLTAAPVRACMRDAWSANECRSPPRSPK